MEDVVTVDGTDVTESRIVWTSDEDWGESINSAIIRFSKTILSTVSLATGLEIVITRGETTGAEENVFEGVITQVKPEVTHITCICKSQLYDAIKNGRTKSWDKDIDTEGGVGSEIVKTYLDYSSINYSSANIISTGTADADKIRKLIQNDEDDYQIIQQIAKIYQYIVYDDPEDGVHFEPKGYTTYPHALVVGTDIPGKLKWKENMEQLINKVKIYGATVYDTREETFAGAATEFELTYTPESTEVRQTDASGALFVRGQKDVGTIDTDFDYYVDTENKTVVFGSSQSNVYIKYGAQVPMPVTLTNTTSINTYGGPNKIPHFKSFTFNSFKDIFDAEKKGREILSKYSTHFNSCEKVPIYNDVIATYGNIKPGHIVSIQDDYNSKELNVFVISVTKAYPHIHDVITVGDEIWRTEDWKTVQMQKINQLFNELNKNQSISISVFDETRDVTFERRYAYLETKDVSGGNPWIVGSASYSIVGTSAVGAFGVFVTTKIVQGDNTYKEYVYDNVFEGTCSASWDSSASEFYFSNPGIQILSKEITLGTQYTSYTVSIGELTGSVLIEITGDGGTNWEIVTLNTKTAFTVTDTTGVKFRITENAGGLATIACTYKDSGAFDHPVIKIILEE